MVFNNWNHEQLEKIKTQLDQALYSHQQWHNSLIRSLVCRLPGDTHDMSPNAHRECRFGQWYYNDSPKEISTHPGFVAIGEAHHNMHGLASRLLEGIKKQQNISTLDYDHFANALEQLRLEIYTLQNELNTLLYSRDVLTGATNRVNMLTILRELQEFSKRQNHPCYIAMMDLDYFKKINDAYGHTSGDKVLSTISSYIIKNIRPYDKLFRYGGEEFLLCLQPENLKTGLALLERLREEISQMEIVINSHTIKITVSFGLTLLDPNLPVEKSIDNADQAMYQAKSEGRNCTRIYNISK